MLKTSRGSALLTSILLMAVISTAAFGIARLALVELDNGQLQTANIKAYYLAEGGMEEGLLRWRYDHEATLISDPGGSRETDKRWQLTGLPTQPSDVYTLNQKPNGDLTTGLVSNKDYVALTLYNQVKKIPTDDKTNVDTTTLFQSGSLADVKNYLLGRPDLHVLKDNKVIIGFKNNTVQGSTPANDINLLYYWDKIGVQDATADWTSGNPANYGLDVRLYQKGDSDADDLLKKEVFSPGIRISNSKLLPSLVRGGVIANIKASMNNTVTDSKKDSYISITPIGADVYLAAFPNSTGKEVVDTVTHLESIGIANGRMRKLATTIDRTSGQILGLYDYVLYAGQ